mmetsp:Transcript_61417/g.183025  ORF Transcript_61417/g.183025 Transcript_61417/m.183025 type:complete len:234 (+) Transcript_61417:739-1440(+)
MDCEARPLGEGSNAAAHLRGLRHVGPKLPRECCQVLAFSHGLGIPVESEHVLHVQVGWDTEVLGWVKRREGRGIQSEVRTRALEAHLRLGGKKDAPGDVPAPARKEVHIVKGKNVVPASAASKVRQIPGDLCMRLVQPVEIVEARELMATRIRGNEKVVCLFRVECTQRRRPEEVMETDISAPLAVVAKRRRPGQLPDTRHVRLSVDIDAEERPRTLECRQQGRRRGDLPVRQ